MQSKDDLVSVLSLSEACVRLLMFFSVNSTSVIQSSAKSVSIFIILYKDILLKLLTDKRSAQKEG